MTVKNFTTLDIAERMMATLPSRFDTSDSNKEIVKFFNGLANALQFNFLINDEFIRQTNIESASGYYLDQYIGEMTGIGRKTDETDAAYRERYYNRVFIYNSTSGGIWKIVYDYNGTGPLVMYNGIEDGAFWDLEYYYDDVSPNSIYGGDDEAYTGYIEFGREVRDDILDELCKVISASKAAGIRIYLVWPADNDLIIDLTEGENERSLVS